MIRIARFLMWMGALLPATLVALLWGVEGVPLYVSIFFTLASAGLVVRLSCLLDDREEQIDQTIACLLYERTMLEAELDRRRPARTKSLKNVQVPDSLPEDI